MTAKGKINASNLQVNDRIIVKVHEGGLVRESATKTGENVIVTRVIGKSFRAAQGPYEARGKYVIDTADGVFEAAPIQTMFLAPEDAAGIKRAHVEALAENAARDLAAAEAEINIVGKELGDAWASEEITNEVFDSLQPIHHTALRVIRQGKGRVALDLIKEIRDSLKLERTPKAVPEYSVPEHVTARDAELSAQDKASAQQGAEAERIEWFREAIRLGGGYEAADLLRGYHAAVARDHAEALRINQALTGLHDFRKGVIPGACDALVTRPDGTITTCLEPALGPIHDPVAYLAYSRELKTALARWANPGLVDATGLGLVTVDAPSAMASRPWRRGKVQKI